MVVESQLLVKLLLFFLFEVEKIFVDALGSREAQKDVRSKLTKVVEKSGLAGCSSLGCVSFSQISI